MTLARLLAEASLDDILILCDGQADRIARSRVARTCAAIRLQLVAERWGLRVTLDECEAFLAERCAAAL